MERMNPLISFVFQSTRPRGARHVPGFIAEFSHSFNPRAHAGRDPERGSAALDGPGFNPRAHAGRDPGNTDTSRFFDVSIHAPTRGATFT